jgi:hypothetical protein
MRWTVWSVCGLAILAAQPGAAQEAAHVRAVVPVIGPLIARGIEHSVTFRELVAAIDASDSNVYVKKGSCRHTVRACLVAVTAAESARFVWVTVDVHTADAELISRIGHELRHAIEVIEQPAVRDNDSMFFLYKRIGTHLAGSTIETNAAMVADHRIREELRDFERPGRE